MVQRWLNKYRLVVQLLLLSIGLVLVFLPIVLPLGGQWNLVSFSLGTSMLAAILLSLFELLLGTDIPTIMEQKFEFNRQVYDQGLEAVYLHGNTLMLDRFETAHSIDMMAVSAKGTCEQYGMRLIHAIENYGCKARMLISDPDNIIWGNQAAIDGLCPRTDIVGEIRGTIEHLKYLESELKQHKSSRKEGSLEVRVYPCLPTSGILIIDGKMVRHTPLLPFFHSIESPAYDITRERGGKLFVRYQDTFDRVWDSSKPILKVDLSHPPNR